MGIPIQIDSKKPPSRLYEGIDYEEFWAGESKYKLDQEERAVIQELLPDTGRWLIDVGCGYGRLSDCYKERFERILMLDGSLPYLKSAREKMAGRAMYIVADVNRLPFRSASFDCILMIRVFHHVPDTFQLLGELKRILCACGILVFSYSNKRNARQILSWLFRRTADNPFTPEPTGVGTTFIHHHPDFVHRALFQSGFSRMLYRGVGVMDKFAGKMGGIERWLPSGARIASFFGALKIAPWIICRAIVKQMPGMNENPPNNNVFQRNNH